MSRPRPAVPATLRHSVFEAGAGLCSYCDVPLHYRDRWHLDHVQPFSVGGPTNGTNLVAACEACNLLANAKLYPTFWRKRDGVRRLRGFRVDRSAHEVLGRVKHLSPHLLKGKKVERPGIFLPPNSNSLVPDPARGRARQAIGHCLSRLEPAA